MVAFEDLPQTTRALLVTKASLEIATAGCANIVELARKRRQTVSEVWEDICQKSGQSRCPTPPQLMESQGSANRPFAAATPATPASAPSSTNATSSTHIAAPLANARGVHTMPATRPVSAPRTKAENANTIATLTQVKGASPARRAQRASNKPVLLTAGLGVLLVVGIGIYMVARTFSPSSAVRPAETIRIERVRIDEPAREASKQPAEPINLPAPQGTIRRMEAISKAFK